MALHGVLVSDLGFRDEYSFQPLVTEVTGQFHAFAPHPSVFRSVKTPPGAVGFPGSVASLREKQSEACSFLQNIMSIPPTGCSNFIKMVLVDYTQYSCRTQTHSIISPIDFFRVTISLNICDDSQHERDREYSITSPIPKEFVIINSSFGKTLRTRGLGEARS